MYLMLFREFLNTFDSVKLCTMHTAKGLEFMRVILPQFYQGMIPQSWVKNDEEMIQQRNVAMK